MSPSVHTFPMVVTTDAAGAGTVLSRVPVSGYVLSLRAPNAASQLTTGGSADFTVTIPTTGATVFVASNLSAPFEYHPRPALNTSAGGTSTQPAYIDRGWPIDDHLKLVVAQGALSTSGTLFVTVESISNY